MIRVFLLLAVLNGLLVSQLVPPKPVSKPTPKRSRTWALAEVRSDAAGGRHAR